MTTSQTDAPTLQKRLRNNHLNDEELCEAADALDAHEATIAAMVEALDRIVIASDYYGKEPVDHDELTLAYAHQSTGNIARAALAKAAALKGSSNAHK